MHVDAELPSTVKKLLVSLDPFRSTTTPGLPVHLINTGLIKGEGVCKGVGEKVSTMYIMRCKVHGAGGTDVGWKNRMLHVGWERVGIGMDG